MSALSVRCSECGAEPGAACATPDNRARDPHRVRFYAAIAEPKGNGDRNWLLLACLSCSDVTDNARLQQGRIGVAPLASGAVEGFVRRHRRHELRGLHSVLRLWFDVSDLGALELEPAPV